MTKNMINYKDINGEGMFKSGGKNQTGNGEV
jgi:hypothetical protein